MIKKVVVKNLEGVVTHGATSEQFESLQAFEAWIAETSASGAWGKPERWLADTLLNPLSDEEKALALETRQVEQTPAIPEQTLEDGTIVPAVPATYITEYKFGAEFTVEVTDITLEVEAEKAVAKYEARIVFFTKMMAKLAAQQSALIASQALTIEQALSNKAALAPVKDFGLEGSLGFALAALQQAEVVVVDKAPYIAEIQAYLAAEA